MRRADGAVAYYNESLGRDAIYVFAGVPAGDVPPDAVAIVVGTENNGIYPGPEAGLSAQDAASIARQTVGRTDDAGTAAVQAVDGVFSALSAEPGQPRPGWMVAAVAILAGVLVLLARAVLGQLGGGFMPLRARDMVAYDGRKAAVGRGGFEQPPEWRKG